MERVNRFRALIYAAIAFAVLLCTALFSLSFAKWDVVGAAESTATSNGANGAFYIDYPQPVTESATPPQLADNIDDSESNSIVLQFKTSVTDATPITVKLLFTGASANLFAHIWCDDKSLGFKGTGWGELLLSDGGAYKKATMREETKKIAWSQLTGFIIANGSAQTGDNDIQNKLPSLRDNYIYTIPLTQSGTALVVGSVSAAEYSAGGGAEPEIKYGEASKTVRHVKANGTSVYKNYVCVSREYEYAADGTLAEASGTPTSAFVEFSVSGADLSATVEEFSVTRAFVDSDGAPSGGKSEMRVYGSPVGKTLADVNNAYVVCDFADGAERYYAMDVRIVTTANATYELTATARHSRENASVEAGKFYLMVNGVTPTEMSRSLGASKTIDQSVMLTLAENTMFKMVKTANADSLDGATWYSPATGAKVDCPQNGISAEMDTSASADYGNIRLTNPAGKYLVRYIADTDAAYDAVSVQMILVERCAGLGNELQKPDDGYYVVGSFSEFKLFDGCKMTPNANIEGVYEYTLPDAVRYTPVYAIAHVSDGEITYGALNTALNGAKVYYDAFAGAAIDGAALPAYRFVADVSATDADADSMTLGYRYSIDGLQVQKPDGAAVDVGSVSEYDAVNGLQFETGGFGKAADGSGLYFVDIADESIVGKTSNLNLTVTAGTPRSIVSVTVHSGNGVNSFNINRYTAGGFTAYDKGHSYRITADASKPTAAGASWQPSDFHNWTGALQRFADGELGEKTAFGMQNAGYAIVRDDGFVVELDRTTDSTTHPYIAKYHKTDGTARTFTVFVNGNAKSLNNDDDIPRIRKIDGYPYEFSTINSEKAKGYYKFNVGDNNINITFSTFDADSTSPIVGVDKASLDTGKYTADKLWKAEYDAYENSYFVFGQFTGWTVYPEFVMTADPDMAGYYSYVNGSIITTADTTGAGAIAAVADKYKIVYLEKTVYNGNTYAQLTYIGEGGGTTGGAPNITATDTAIYYDAFSGKPCGAPDGFHRIIFDTSSIPSNWGGTINGFKLHYWNVNETNDYRGDWNARPAMLATGITGDGSNYNPSTGGKLYYFDINGATHLLGADIKGIIVTFNQSGEGEKQSWGMEKPLELGKSYVVTMNGGGGSDDNGTWKWHPKLVDNGGTVLFEKA